ncbi:AraC family transcriptional regulator [Rhizobium sp. CECT 9324]|uniref:helix-turn-helix domain-containing protein n=1 Tax=Rhizobium sp. CECT 9324 TaxID=2845820 RepID=UPI001E2C92FD|nr:AraC family transcriptional regulator [Rhizobium sp. CECT 9324]
MKRSEAGWFDNEAQLASPACDGLERSCSSVDLIRTGAETRGIERIEAMFYGNQFSPHRHDTYALGLTLSGVQTFAYRGMSRFSMPGNVIVLHPDELHDGGAGTEVGLHYRMMYIPPEYLREAGAGGATALPFVANPVLSDAGLAQALAEALADLENPIGDLAHADLLSRIADGIGRHAQETPRLSPRAERAVQKACVYLRDNATTTVLSEDLEAVTDLNRYSLARQFRLATGTSPHRYQVMRRLEQAKRLMLKEVSIAEAAIAVGFADQSHLTRHFKASYGMPPGRWLILASQGRPVHSH